MWFIDDIFSLVWDIAGWFYDAYYEVSGWVWPFYYLANPLYWIYQCTWSLLTPIAQFRDWAYDVWDKVQNILDEAGVLSLLRTWLNYAEWAWGWVSNAWYNVWNIVEDWWSSAQYIVKSWIQDVQDLALSFFNLLNAWLSNLQTAWDNFKGMIPSLSEVVSWFGDWWARILAPLTSWWNERLLDAQALIDSTLKTWFPFYDDLVKLWGDISLFFTDPLEYLWERFSYWFFGKE